VGDVPGVKGLRLMEGQPVALGPLGPNFSQGKQHRLELTLEDGTIQNIGISETAYRELMAGLVRQGVTLEQRLMARAVVASEKDHEVVAEQAMPLDVSVKQAVETLKEVGKPSPLAKELTWDEVRDHDYEDEMYDPYEPEEEDE
jgi:hypothetical protein